MPITPFLETNHNFDPETKRVMGVAFETTCAIFRVEDTTDDFAAMIAKRIIHHAKKGVRSPSLLCEKAVTDLLGL
jgi:hypothetical protein